MKTKRTKKQPKAQTELAKPRSVQRVAMRVTAMLAELDAIESEVSHIGEYGDVLDETGMAKNHLKVAKAYLEADESA